MVNKPSHVEVSHLKRVNCTLGNIPVGAAAFKIFMAKGCPDAVRERKNIKAARFLSI